MCIQYYLCYEDRKLSTWSHCTKTSLLETKSKQVGVIPLKEIWKTILVISGWKTSELNMALEYRFSWLLPPEMRGSCAIILLGTWLNSFISDDVMGVGIYLKYWMNSNLSYLEFKVKVRGQLIWKSPSIIKLIPYVYLQKGKGVALAAASFSLYHSTTHCWQSKAVSLSLPRFECWALMSPSRTMESLDEALSSQWLQEGCVL